MNKLKYKKNITITVIILAFLLCIGLYKYSKFQDYNKVITTANNHMKQEQYDKAIEKFKESLNYKKDKAIDKKIKEAEEMKESKKVYDEGVKLLQEKKYEDAFSNFYKIKENTGKIYVKSKDKIAQCKNELLNLSNEEIKEQNYNEANKYLDIILKYDSKNKQAIDIKNGLKTKVEEKNNGEKEINFIEKNKIKGQIEQKNKVEEKVLNYEKVYPSNIISESKARYLAESVKPSEITLNYLGIEKVPYAHITTPYKVFPKELKNKKVYVFEGVFGNKDNSYAVSQYYVDFVGRVYKDTYPSNGKCIRVK